ncbi:hypothetical protein ABZ612_20550 [Streptomyces avermitilis]|uniref:hypothetical protein n=1 Tax=Streptomyces avermitilis TaxID=33903 RepID=UPI0033E5EBA1
MDDDLDPELLAVLEVAANAEEPRRIDFAPVRNGVDYLLSAVTHLTEVSDPPSDRDLKYAVLHLHAATEVLLKARLVSEHWSLVFKDPAKATRKNYVAGRFSSTTVEGAISRLRDIAGVDIGESNRAAITKLSETRNAFTHYGHSASAPAIESQATRVLDFLVDFIDEHLHEQASQRRPGDDVGNMRLIRARLGKIDSLVKARMRDVTAGLGDLLGQTVQCPACRQYAVVAGEAPHCRFCKAKWSTPNDLAVLYVLSVVGQDNGQLQACGSCELDGAATTLVLGVSTADEPNKDDVGLCFRCGVKYHAKWTLVTGD